MYPPTTLVVIDPDAARRRRANEALEAAGFRVFSSALGADALSLCRAYRPRMVLLSVAIADIPWASLVAGIRTFAGERRLAIAAVHDESASIEDRIAALDTADDSLSCDPADPDFANLVRLSIARQTRVEAALQRREAQFHELADNIEEGFYNYDIISRQPVYANAALGEIWGRTVTDLYGRPGASLEAVHPDDRAAVKETRRRTLEGEETTLTYRIVRPDNDTRWISEHARPVGPAGEVQRVIGTVRDITSATRVGRLRAWEASVLAALTTGTTLPVILDQIVRGAEQFTAHAWASIHLVDQERRLRYGAAPSLPKAYNDAIDGIAIGPSSGSCSTAAYRAEPVIVTDVMTDPLWDDYRELARTHGLRACWSVPVLTDGEVTATFALYYREPRAPQPDDLNLIEDMARLTSVVLERDKRERSLRTQAALLDKAQDAIVVCDLAHRIQYWNRGAERLYGWTAEQARGQSARNLLRPNGAAFDAASAATLASGEWTGELEHHRRDRRPVEVESRWTLVRDDEGEPQAILSIDTNITERKRLETQMLRVQRLESIGTLAGGIAHDLNNLLAPIMMGVSLLQESETRPAQREVLRTMQTSTERGADLVRQVLSFSRGVEGARVRVSLTAIVQEVGTFVTSSFPKNISFHTSLAAQLDDAQGDSTQIAQVLLNLCVNARDAMPDGGRLTIAARNVTIGAGREGDVHPGPYVEVEVTDTGTGMPRHVQDQVFDPFFTTKDPGRGTGLGLPTVLSIVRGHGGFVEIQSSPGRGCTFRVVLPAAKEPNTPVESQPAGIADLPRGRGELVLVVDDELAMLELMRRTIESAGYRVQTASSGDAALELFAAHRDDVAVIFTDMMMPGMDGAALVAAIRQQAVDVPIIASSGLNAQDNVERVTNLGVTHFLPKPYRPGALLSLLRTVIDERR